MKISALLFLACLFYLLPVYALIFIGILTLGAMCLIKPITDRR